MSGRRKLLPGLRIKDGYMRHPFDLANGVETSGLIHGSNLVSGHRHDRHNTAYFGVAPSIFRAICRMWRKTIPRRSISHYSFIDVGAGMGRAMLMAAEMPFRNVTGIELSHELSAVAKKNYEHWTASGRALCPMCTEIVDATEFKFPLNPCVLFLFNPFGATVLRRLIKSIENAFTDRHGQLDLLYVNHEHERLLSDHSKFAQVWSGEISKSCTDEVADRKIIYNQSDGIYAPSEYESCSIYRWIGQGAADTSTDRT